MNTEQLLSLSRRIKRATWRNALLITADLATPLARRGIAPPFRTSSYAAISDWLHQAAQVPAERGKHIAVYALRNQWWLEWASYTCCRLHVMGFRPILLYSQTELRDGLRIRPWERNYSTIALHNDVYPSIDIEPFVQAQLDKVANDGFALEASISLAYDTGKETSSNQDELKTLRIRIAAHEWVASHLTASLELSRAIIPSGIIGSTAGLLSGFRQSGIDVACVESWGLTPGHMLWNLNAPALHFDYRGWMDLVGELSPNQEREVLEYLRFQDNPTDSVLAGKTRAYQLVSANNALPQHIDTFINHQSPYFLLGTNVIGDSATLGRQTIFETQKEWLTKTIEWFQANPRYRLVIRVHPGELIGPTPLPLAPLAKELSAGHPNVLVVGPDERVNSYALARRAKGAAVFVSNLGVDLSARGLPVISVGRTPYSGLGITAEPKTEEQYFEQLYSIFSGNQIVPDDAAIQAKRVIHVLIRLVSLPGSPYLKHPHRHALDGDELSLFYRLLAGDAERVDCF